MYAFIKMILVVVVAALAMGQDYGYGHSSGGSGGYGHGYEKAISSQNYVLHSYHPVPVVYKKAYESHGYEHKY